MKKLLSEFNYCIFVPSRARKDFIEKRIGVWRYISKENPQYPFKLVLREKEIDDYYSVGYAGKILTVLNSSSIADKRQAIIDFCIQKEIKYAVVIDDDVSFHYRDENLSSKYTSKFEEIVKRNIVDKILYESLQLCGEKYPLIGLPLKQGSFGLKYTFPKNIPIIRFACYCIPIIKKEKIFANGLNSPIMEDRYLQLSLLNKGYRSLSNCRYAVEDMGSNIRGGCSVTRTIEIQNNAARELTKSFSNYVKLKVKDDGHWKERRLDCRISWKKFLKANELPYLPKSEGLKLIGE